MRWYFPATHAVMGRFLPGLRSREVVTFFSLCSLRSCSIVTQLSTGLTALIIVGSTGCLMYSSERRVMTDTPLPATWGITPLLVYNLLCLLGWNEKQKLKFISQYCASRLVFRRLLDLSCHYSHHFWVSLVSFQPSFQRFIALNFIVLVMCHVCYIIIESANDSLVH